MIIAEILPLLEKREETIILYPNSKVFLTFLFIKNTAGNILRKFF